MIKEELMMGTHVFPQDGDIFKSLSEVANKISDAMNEFFREDVFEKYLAITKEQVDALVYVNSEDYSTILMLPRVLVSPVSGQLFNSNAINGLTYKLCSVPLSSLTLKIVCLPIYKGEPTCDIKKLFNPSNPTDLNQIDWEIE